MTNHQVTLNTQASIFTVKEDTIEIRKYHERLRKVIV